MCKPLVLGPGVSNAPATRTWLPIARPEESKRWNQVELDPAAPPENVCSQATAKPPLARPATAALLVDTEVDESTAISAVTGAPLPSKMRSTRSRFPLEAVRVQAITP